MKLVFYSIVLNHHQAPVADAFYRLLGDDYIFVETGSLHDMKGATEDYSSRPYLLKAAQNADSYSEAMRLAETAECCVFSGLEALPFQKVRMQKGLLSFDMSERWLKRGWMNVFSPTIFRLFLAYHLGGWKNKPIYKLCCSAFAKQDQYALGTYRDKCYKWGYFTQVNSSENLDNVNQCSEHNIVRIMWCARFLKLKHPELPILLAQRLMEKGYRFVLNMYGEGEYAEQAKDLVKKLQLEDIVCLKGNVPNDQLMKNMARHDLFLFTSDRNEGWGAVANESLSNGCILISSDGIGSAPYLVNEGANGFLFRSPNIDSSLDAPDVKSLDDLLLKVDWLFAHPEERSKMKQCARLQMQTVWSPQVAAERLLSLIDGLNGNAKVSFKEGPCSKA